MITPGSQAPEFSLPSTDGTEVTLSSLKGNPVVLYFYPKDSTPGCTTEACDFRDWHPEFEKIGVKVLGVSADSIASHGKFSAKHGLPFPLLSDESKETLERYGVWQQKKLYGKTFLGIVRTTFLIDKNGIVVKVWDKVKVAGHAAEVMEEAKKLV